MAVRVYERYLFLRIMTSLSGSKEGGKMMQDQSRRCPKCRSVMVVKGTVTTAKPEELMYCAGCGHEEWQSSSEQSQIRTQNRRSFA
jgi:hypothetical protein